MSWQTTERWQEFLSACDQQDEALARAAIISLSCIVAREDRSPPDGVTHSAINFIAKTFDAAPLSVDSDED